MYQIENISINNKEARFMHINKVGAEPLLFIPGNLQEIETIKDFNNGLSNDFDYWVLEIPGTGMTKPLHPHHSIPFLSDCLASFIETHIKRPVHLVVCSYATPIAIEFAKHNNHWLKKLVLAGSMREIPQAEWATVLGLMADCLRNPERFAADFLDLLTTESERIPRQNLIIKATMRKAARYSTSQFWCFIYNSIRLMSYYPEDLGLIKCPTLCFTGELDPYVTKERCRELANEIPNSYFTTIPDTDHLFHIEKPHETISLITEYLLSKRIARAA